VTSRSFFDFYYELAVKDRELPHDLSNFMRTTGNGTAFRGCELPQLAVSCRLPPDADSTAVDSRVATRKLPTPIDSYVAAY
jgi:hypothetical protein